MLILLQYYFAISIIVVIRLIFIIITVEPLALADARHQIFTHNISNMDDACYNVTRPSEARRNAISLHDELPAMIVISMMVKKYYKLMAISQ